MTTTNNHTSASEQYLQQSSWRPHSQMFHALQSHLLSSNDNDTLKESKTKKKALDLGCGPGNFVHYLRNKHGWDVIGMDQDSEMIFAAEQQQQQQREHNNNTCDDEFNYFIQGDVTTIPESSDEMMKKKFDLIWCSFLIQYFSSRSKEIISKWMNMLNPGGLLAIVETQGLFAVHEPQANDGAETFRQMESELFERYGYDTMAGSKLEAVLEDCGLEIVSGCPSEWNDPEFAFDGPASPEIVKAWDQRFERMKFPKQYFTREEFQERKEAFLECLQSEEHRTTTKIRLIVGRKKL